MSKPQLKTIGTHRFEGIYIGYDSPSIIRYLSIPAGTLFRARFQNSHFDENIFPSLPNTKNIGLLDFFALQTFTQNPNPHIALTEQEVRKLISLKGLADRLPDGFSDAPRITKDPAPGAGLPSLRNLPKKHKAKVLHTDLQASEPTSLEEAQKSSEWPQWSLALQAKYDSLRKHQVFGSLVLNLPTKPMGHKLIFTKKQNPDGQVIRYKVRLVAHGFNQRPGLDYDFTYSTVVDSGTFRYLLGIVVQFSLKIQLLDVVTVYLHGPLDAELYIKPPPDFMPNPIPPESPRSFLGFRIQKALYGLKQAGRMWYQHLKDFLTSHEFLTDHTLPCIFISWNQKEFVIVAAYVDDLNLIGTESAITHAMTLLTEKFQMKFLGPTTLCLGLQVKHLKYGSLFLHQTAYTQKILKRFSMDQAHPLSAPLMERSKTNNDSYSPCEEEEEDELDESHYLATVGALLYLATYTRPDISFVVTVLARHSQKPTSRHWARIKHLFRYLRGTEDLGLQYT